MRNMTAEQGTVSLSKEIHYVVNPVWETGLALCLLLVLTLTVLSYISLAEGTLNSCGMAREKLAAALTGPYSGTERAPNLLEPVALAFARKKLSRFVDQKSQFECAAILYHLWMNPEKIKTQIEGVNQ